MSTEHDSKVANLMNNQAMEMEQLSAAHIEAGEYRILSARNGSVTAYSVDVEDMECSCPDKEYNKDDHEVCAHLAKALLVHTAHYDAGEWAVRDIRTLTDRATSLTRELQDTVDWTKAVIESEASHAASEHAASANGTEANGTGEDRSLTPTEACDKLQGAFDECIDGFNVKASKQAVWVNKTPDAPDELPGPGNVDSFDAFLKSPEQTVYVHDDHRLASEAPGQYFNNAIAPSDVPTYIEEVLE